MAAPSHVTCASGDLLFRPTGDMNFSMLRHFMVDEEALFFREEPPDEGRTTISGDLGTGVCDRKIVIIKYL